MRLTLRSAAIAALIITASCAKDTVKEAVEDNVDPLEEQANLLEETPLGANMVADNVVIQGGTKNDGAPPIPNGAISLDLSNAGNTAFLNEGFDVPLSSDGNIVGAYIQFKSNDGTISDSYYDVNLAENVSSGKKKSATKRAKNPFAKKKNEDSGFNIDVDFNTTIEPGTFCYVICVYDSEGNISEPSEVCVTVESWGGTSAVVANWNFVKEEDTTEGNTTITMVGDTNCEAETTNDCVNGSVYTASECETIEYASLTINSDGTYSLDSEYKEKELNYEMSRESCEAVYIEKINRNQSAGNWAYVTSESRLVLVEYSYTSLENGIESESGTYPAGEGELSLDGRAEVDGNSFVIIEADDFDGDGIAEDTIKYFFEK